MKRVLVTYASRSGSTAEIAQFIADTLAGMGIPVEVFPADAYLYLARYDAVIAGGLLYRTGLHPQMVEFLRTNQAALKSKPVAYFITGLGLVLTHEQDMLEPPVFVDPNIIKPRNAPGKLKPLEKLLTFDHYMQFALDQTSRIHPISIGFFAGKLNFSTLNLMEKLIMKVLLMLTGKKAGDHRNWDALREWTQMVALQMVEPEGIPIPISLPSEAR
jgi:menaquinone-dependent protoporphyrinogen oxidase